MTTYPDGRTRNTAITARQGDVLREVAEGQTNAQIAYRLGVTQQTVKNHLTEMFERLGANDRAHAVAIGFRTGLLGQEETR